MPGKLNLGYKECLYCGEKIKLVITRDIKRKKFCNKKCHAHYYSDLGTFNNKGKKFSEKHRMKISKYRKMTGSWKGKDNPNYKGVISIGSKMSEENKRLASERMKNGGAAKARKACGGKRSSLQLKVEAFLDREGITYQIEKIINNHAVDIFIKPNICIECDGSYWHSLPEQKVRDLLFENYCDWSSLELIRLKEEDIKNNVFENILNLKLYATSDS